MSPSYRRRFDAKAYWALKTLCTVCKVHKVKDGEVCYECKKEEKKKQKIELNNLLNMNQTEETNTTLEEFSQDQDYLFNDADLTNKKTVSLETQNKIVRLFTYLENALALDDSDVRDFRTKTAPPSPWWLADYPRDVENLYIKPFDDEKNDSSTQIGAWLKVEKKNIKPAPNLPEELLEWVGV